MALMVLVTSTVSLMQVSLYCQHQFVVTAPHFGLASFIRLYMLHQAMEKVLRARGWLFTLGSFVNHNENHKK